MSCLGPGSLYRGVEFVLPQRLILLISEKPRRRSPSFFPTLREITRPSFQITLMTDLGVL